MLRNQNHLAFFFTALIALALLVLALLSTGINAETDSIAHYQIARYAFTHPQLFLDHWGKPLFTLLASPFAQFGYFGAVGFNIICGLLSAWLAYKIAKKAGFEHSWTAILFAIFAPVYLYTMYTSLTETLFSLVLMFSLYLFISGRFVWSAIVISFIPFVRNEGVVFLIQLLPLLIIVKQYKAIPFLLSGFLIYSLAGIPVYSDFLWLFNKIPYSQSGSELYGSGSFWFYFKKMEYIMNYPLMGLTILGLIMLVKDWRKYRVSGINTRFVAIYLYLIPAFFGYILLQSFLWWKGLMGVLASTRFISSVLPLSAILSAAGFSFIYPKLTRAKVYGLVAAVLIILSVIYVPFSRRMLPMQTPTNFLLMEKLTDWLKQNNYEDKKAYYSDPMFVFYLDGDPWNNSRFVRCYSYLNWDWNHDIKPGELLIWDAQFTGYEGKLPFDSLVANKNFTLLKTFTPSENVVIIGGGYSKAAIFIRNNLDKLSNKTGN